MASNTIAGIGTDLEVINACLELVMSMNSKNYLQRVLEILVGHCQAVCGHIGDTGNTYFAKYPSDDVFDKHEGFSKTFSLGFGKYLHNAVGHLVLCRTTPFDEHLLLRVERLLPAISCIFLICKNYTELKHQRNTFLLNVSHELRTPLNGIVCMAGMLQNVAVTSEQREFIDIITTCSIQLLDIINDILDYSRVSMGELKLNEGPVFLETCLNNSMDIMQAKMHSLGINIVKEYDSSIPACLLGDTTRIMQIFINIIGNAIKFTTKGSITVRLCLDAIDDDCAYLEFTVKDTGCGMPKEAVLNIFDAYHQSGPGKKYMDAKYGLGLGLPITRYIIEKMGGHLNIDSKLGEGTCVHATFKMRQFNNALTVARERFSGQYIILYDTRHADHVTDRLFSYIRELEAIPVLCKTVADISRYIRTLPIAATVIIGNKVADILPSPVIYADEDTSDEAFYCSIGAAVKHEVHSDKKARILVAEDNYQNQQVMVKLLQTLKYTDIRVVNNGQEMLKALMSKDDIDVCLVDLKMPVMDGLTAVKRYMQDVPDRDRVVFIAVTASISEDMREECLRAGMLGYIVKPVNLQYLDTLIRRHLK